MLKRLLIGAGLLFVLVLSSCGVNKEELEQEVKASIIEQNDDPNISIEEVNLVSTGDNTYEGYVNTVEYGEDYQYNITVVVDGDEFIWEVY